MSKDKPTLPVDNMEFEDFDMDLTQDQAILTGLDDMDKDEEDKKNAAAEEAAKKKEESEKESSKSKYSKEELLSIFDTILFEGQYEEMKKIGSRYSVKFRTRSVKESNEITRRIDKLELGTIMAVQNFTNVLTLTYAISEINGVSLAGVDFANRYEKIQGLPESLIVLLSHKLREFDMKVMEAMKEGDENF